MEKNIVIVVREGLALRNDNGVATTFTGVASVESVLCAVKSTLEGIQTNAQGLEKEFTHLYVPSLIGGLLGNLVGLYKRTGKTREGNVISAAELNLYIEVDRMLKDRSDNIRLVNLKHVRKNDLNMETLIKKTWVLLDREERKMLTQARAGITTANTAQSNAQAGISPEVAAMQQQMAAMQQMMQQMMQMNNMMMNTGMQMPNVQMPASTTASVDTATVGTTLNIDPSAIAGVTAQQTENTQSEEVIKEYYPEF